MQVDKMPWPVEQSRVAADAVHLLALLLDAPAHGVDPHLELGFGSEGKVRANMPSVSEDRQPSQAPAREALHPARERESGA